MNEHVQVAAVIAAAFLGPAGALAVGIRWLERTSAEWRAENSRRFDRLEKALGKINGNVDTHGERLVSLESDMRNLPCTDPEYRRRAIAEKFPPRTK